MNAELARHQCDAPILINEVLQGEYRRMVLELPAIAAEAMPGQFVHLKLGELTHRLLRRPFSICDADADAGTVSVVYKIVGEGTRAMAELPIGAVVNALGPLGRGYSAPRQGDGEVILVGGGYGCAAMFLQARRCGGDCRCLFGGRTADDVLLVREFEALGCSVEISTDDGSLGHRGLVTDLLESALDTASAPPQVQACGPNPMLEAVARLVMRRGLDAEVSLDHVMCCGVGACFACVVKKKADNENGWEYVRTCLDGPVFLASEIAWDAEEGGGEGGE